jgi:protein-S-isoprenylcysteine O-methyltransferase Ste14
MYAGATLVLGGAAIFYGSLAVLVYALLFWLTAHIAVVFFEEPALRRLFGDAYETYSTEVGRWWPHRNSHSLPASMRKPER